MNLKNRWIELVSKFTYDMALISQCFETLKKECESTGRFYHNLSHIENMLSYVEIDKTKLNDLNSILFAIWFHDIIYDIKRSNSEEKSAATAENFLKKLNYDDKKIYKVKQMILKTKNHSKIDIEEDYDTQYFLDLDLLILGASAETYRNYAENVRKEYSFVPKKIYNEERIKILENFLNQDSLYRTERFQELYETQARKNLKSEIKSLSTEIVE